MCSFKLTLRRTFSYFSPAALNERECFEFKTKTGEEGGSERHGGLQEQIKWLHSSQGDKV